MNNDYITPQERVRPGRRTAGQWILDARLDDPVCGMRARIRRWLRARSDLFVVYLSVTAGLIVWFALDDLVAWIFGLPVVTL